MRRVGVLAHHAVTDMGRDHRADESVGGLLDDELVRIAAVVARLGVDVHILVYAVDGERSGGVLPGLDLIDQRGAETVHHRVGADGEFVDPQLIGCLLRHAVGGLADGDDDHLSGDRGFAGVLVGTGEGVSDAGRELHRGPFDVERDLVAVAGERDQGIVETDGSAVVASAAVGGGVPSSEELPVVALSLGRVELGREGVRSRPSVTVGGGLSAAAVGIEVDGV